MNIKSLIVVSLISIVGLSSCNKCKQCSYKYKISGVDTSKSFVKECGSAKTLDKYVSSSKAEAARYNAISDTCETVK